MEPFELILRRRKAKILPYFSNAALEKRTDHPPWKMPHGFSQKGDGKPYFKFHTKQVVLLIYRTIPTMFGFREWIADFEGMRISRCLDALCRVHRRIQCRTALILISIDIYSLYCGSCEIWRWVNCLGFERYDDTLSKLEWEIDRFWEKKVKLFKPRHLDFYAICALHKAWKRRPLGMYLWYRLIDRMQIAQVTFEVELLMSFIRKGMSKEMGHFFKGRSRKRSMQSVSSPKGRTKVVVQLEFKRQSYNAIKRSLLIDTEWYYG
jgi:hypothetical protein